VELLRAVAVASSCLLIFGVFHLLRCQCPLHRAPRHPFLRSGPVGPCAIFLLNLNPFLRRSSSTRVPSCAPAPFMPFPVLVQPPFHD